MILGHLFIHALIFFFYFFLTRQSKPVSNTRRAGVCAAACRCPAAVPAHSPHTISSSTNSSVATTTSSVSPTLCHILGAEGRPARGGGAGGARGRRAGPGLQRRRGGMGGGRPQGARRGGAGTHRGRRANPADPPSRRGERGRRRVAECLYPLIAPGSLGRGAGRPRRRRPDALPWRTPRAPVGGEDRRGDARRSHGPRRRPPEGVVGPNERRITSPGSR